jgi:hypothetical protein
VVKKGGEIMKTLILAIILLILANLGFPGIVGSLPGVLKPDNITVYEKELFVVEGAEISIYSLKDLKLKKKFGKKGEGPGELMVTPGFFNKVSVFPDYIFVLGFNKVIFFSREGKYIKEIKKSMYIFLVEPMGENFVVRSYKQGDDKLLYNAIVICNSKFEEIKELYRQKDFQQGAPPNAQLDIVPDLIYFGVYDDKIFIDRSPDGFIVDVFDNQGKKLYQVEKEYEKIKITNHHEKEIIDRFKEDPNIKSGMQRRGGWEALKKVLNINFPDFFPAVQELEITGKKIYIRTFKLKENKSQYVVMDLKGNIIKRVYLPRVDNVPFMSKIIGAKLHTFYNDKLYYLMENEDEEKWELYVEEIK